MLYIYFKMILQVFTDACEICHYRDAKRFERSGVADARKLEQLWRGVPSDPAGRWRIGQIANRPRLPSRPWAVTRPGPAPERRVAPTRFTGPIPRYENTLGTVDA